jgi:ribose transport system substrate-binding protein
MLGSQGSARTRLVLGAAVASLALMASACSNTSQPTDVSDVAGSPSAGGDAYVAEMKQLIDSHRGQPKWKDPGPALDASKLAGKTIAVVAIDLRVPALAEIVQYVKESAGKVGMKVTVFDAKSTASLMQQGMQQAINNGADAIISDGLVIQLIANQIKAAKDKGIPTIDVINTPPKEGVPGQGSDPNVFGNMAPDSVLAGQLVAATAIVQADGKANVGIINTSELTVAPTEIGAMKDTLAKCSGCKVVDEQDVALTDWSTKIQGTAATMVRSHPDMNFVLTLYDAMGLFATPGVQQAGGAGKVRVASVDGTAAALALVKKGDIFVSDTAKDTAWAAWGAVDQAMRGMLDMEPANPVVPLRYIDTSDLKDVDPTSTETVSAALFGNDFRTGYLKLWGLG